MHRGNVGLTSTVPIDPFYYTNGVTDEDLYITANPAAGPPPPPPAGTGFKYGGTLSQYENKVKTPTLTGSSGVTCTQNAAQFECFIDDNAVSPRLVVSNYSNKVQGSEIPLYVCEGPVNNVIARTFLPNTTTIDLSGATGNRLTVTLHVQDGTCN
jgi:hypothetical protein